MPKFKVINGIVKIDKEVNELDKFGLDCVKIIEKYTKYVIISGYVSIFFGRARATEDIDVFIEELPFNEFEKMYNEFLEKGFEFTIDDRKSLYDDYLKTATPISVWRKDFPLLRMEMKFALKPSQKLALNDFILVKFKNNQTRKLKNEFSGVEKAENHKKILQAFSTIKMANIESQIAYKRFVAKSDKDLEDARHLEMVFEDLDKKKIEYYKKIFLKEFENE